MEDARLLYLDLMERCLTHWIYGDRETGAPASCGMLERAAMQFLQSRGFTVGRPRPMNEALRESGRDFEDGHGLPAGHTMIGLKRLRNIRKCLRSILSENIAGDVIEAGVWRGGAAIYMRAVLQAYGVMDRTVWVADSFEGCPQPDAQHYPQDRGVDFYRNRGLAIPLEEVQRNFQRYNLLDDRVRFLKGWFRDTLPGAPIGRLSLLRIDGDLYESTMDALVGLYPKLSAGGYIIIDDYNEVPACKSAVMDFRKQAGIHDPIIEIDRDGIYWRRGSVA